MGTNYYLEYEKCDCCNRSEKYHIGKSAVGWCFGLRIHPDIGINGFDDWVNFLDLYHVTDEYDRVVKKKDMIAIISKRDHPRGLRSHPDGNVIEDGDPTYDICDYEFS